jgi:hypothetical protein
MRTAFHRFVRKVRRSLHLGQVPLEAVLVSTAPIVLRADTVYLIMEDNDPWTVAMRCPCGCSETLFMSLIDGSPRWTHELHSKWHCELEALGLENHGVQESLFPQKRAHLQVWSVDDLR